jgi:hypothetical protein
MPWDFGMLATGEGWYDSARIIEVENGVPVLWEYRGRLRGPASDNGEPRWEEYAASGTPPYPVLGDDGTLLLACHWCESRGVAIVPVASWSGNPETQWVYVAVRHTDVRLRSCSRATRMEALADAVGMLE